MRLALASYRPDWHLDWDALADKLERWVADASGQGADLCVFPEYAGIEAALIGEPAACPGPTVWRDAMCAAADKWADLNATLARTHKLHILAGSLCAQDAGKTVNRTWLCGPGGDICIQDKLIPTPYERDDLGLTGGRTLNIAETSIGRLGILICYDSEFPVLARTLAAAGADLILVPSCTDFPAGQTRVRQSCRARAIEQQIAVAQAPLVGQVAGCDVVDTSTGRAGLFCPPDHGLPPSGILAEGTLDTPGWTIADLGVALTSSARRAGQVGNFDHWDEQATPPVSLTYSAIA